MAKTQSAWNKQPHPDNNIKEDIKENASTIL